MAIVVVFDEYGPPEVLHPVEVPDPWPGPGEVRIRVRAAGVQPFDAATRNGDFAAYNPLPLPSGLGNEVAGVIDAVGDGVTAAAVGDEVIAFLTLRGYADTVVVPADALGRKPAGMPWTEAGVLSASGQTASTALQALHLRAGETLLVHAAAGGVGSFAVQLARAAGVTVIGTASARNHDYLRSLGAVPVAYGPGLLDRVRALGRVDAVLDAIGGEALDVSVQLVARRDRIVTIADWTAEARLGVRRIGTDRSAARLAALITQYADGALTVPVSHAFPLEKAADAHREIETGHARGKIALVSAGGPAAEQPDDGHHQ
jgi:enoyl reductase